MKKFFLLFAAITTLGLASANNNSLMGGGKHTEFRYYGIYGTVDFTYMMNIAPQHDACELTGFAGYNDAYSLMGFTASAGFQWRKESAIGMGFSFLYDMNGSFSQIPIFLEFRSHYTRNRLTPYTSIQMGYSVPFSSTSGGTEYVKINQGGMTFGGEIGGRVAFGRNFGMHLGVGYQLIQCHEVERGVAGEPAVRMPELYHNLKVNVGFNF